MRRRTGQSGPWERRLDWLPRPCGRSGRRTGFSPHRWRQFKLSAATCLLAPDWVYRMQANWFPIPRETFDVVIYAFLGLFKIVFIAFNAVPYVALLIVG